MTDVQDDLREEERVFVEELRPQFENQGYEFQIEPSLENIPEFMAGYKPDAIAIKGDTKIAIEVKVAQSPQGNFSIRRLRTLFEDHPDWHLRVIYKSSRKTPSFEIPSSSPDMFQRRVKETRELLAQGQIRAAFILSWGLLEAAFHMLGPASKRALPTGTIVQSLAMNGHITPETEREIRNLMFLRSSIVHGDLVAEPTKDNAELIMSTAEAIVREGNGGASH